MASDRPRKLPPTLKRLGQHFLTDPGILARIAGSLELAGSETVIEIGPGRGSLTEALLPRVGRLVAVELDHALAVLLRDRYAEDKRVSIVEADVLSADMHALAGGPYSLIGNVPYYITTPIIFRALEPPMPSQSVFLVQREVAERVVAAPGSRIYGALSVNVQAVASAELLFTIPAGAFRPPPKVESAVLRLVPRADPTVPAHELEAFRTFVLAAFSQRRKQLRRVVRNIARLPVDAADAAISLAGLDPEARPETLAPADFARLMRAARSVPVAPQAPTPDS